MKTGKAPGPSEVSLELIGVNSNSWLRHVRES